jgi:hypothetical protein
MRGFRIFLMAGVLAGLVFSALPATAQAATHKKQAHPITYYVSVGD